jgi:hypothetical protein
MVASYDKLQSELAVKMYLDDPADATVERAIGWVAMSEKFMALCLFYTGTGVLTFKIYAALTSAGGTPTLVKAHATPTVADAAGDVLVLETTAEEVAAALAGATHVSVYMDNDAAGDTNVITYIRSNLRFAEDGGTADVIA